MQSDVDANKALFLSALRTGNVENVKVMVGKFSLNYDLEDGKTSLLIAVESGSVEVVRLLLDKGANLGVRDRNGMTALAHACSNDNLDMVKLLVDEYNNVRKQLKLDDCYNVTRWIIIGNRSTMDFSISAFITRTSTIVHETRARARAMAMDRTSGWFLVHTCEDKREIFLGYNNTHQIDLDVYLVLESDSHEVFERLSTVSNGYSVLAHSCLERHTMLTLLSLRNPLINLTNCGPSATSVAYNCSHSCTKVVFETSLQSFVIDGQDTNGCSTLMHAAQHGYHDMIKLLLENGANLSLLDDKGWSALLYACKGGHVHSEVVDLLLAEGATVDKLALKAKESLLMHSCIHGSYKIAKLLFAKTGTSPQIDLSRIDGWSPLLLACKGGHYEVANLLLENGAIVGQSALLDACKGGHYEVVNLLLENGAIVGQSALLVACKGGYYKIAKLLLEKGAQIDSVDSSGQSALFYACIGGHYEVAKLLLEGGKAQVNLKDVDGWSPLIYASDGGRCEVAKLLLENGATPVYMHNGERFSALIYACKVGEYEMVRLLLDRGVQISYQDSEALIHACNGGFIEISYLLLESSAHNIIDLQDNFGGFPLLYACAVGCYRDISRFLKHNTLVRLVDIEESLCTIMTNHSDDYFDVVEILLNGGANVNISNEEGFTALMFACLAGNYKMVKLLLEKHAEVNQLSRHGLSALMAASAVGHYDISKLLLKWHAQVNLLDKDGFSALMFTCATHEGHFDMAGLLLEKGADVNKQSHGEHQSALMLASLNGHRDLVELLLDSEARIDLQNSGGHTALTLATSREHFDVMELLLRRIALTDVSTATIFAIKHGLYEPVKVLFTKLPKVDFQDHDGCTLLVLASQHGNFKVAKYLLEKGADVNLSDNLGQSALMLASQYGHHKVATLLLESDAQVDHQNHNLQSSLMLACKGGHSKLAKVLLDRGAQIDLQDNQGWSALHFASQSNRTETVKLLLRSGASPWLMDQSGKSAQSLAEENDFQAIIKLLKEYDTQGTGQQQVATKMAELTDHDDKSESDDASEQSHEEDIVLSANELIDEDSEDDEESDSFAQGIAEAISRNENLERKLAHGMFVGPTGAGKTSLMDRLLGRPRKKFSPSSGVAEQVVVVDVDIDNPSTFTPVTVMEGNTWEEVEYDMSLVRQMEDGVTISHPAAPAPSPPPTLEVPHPHPPTTDSSQNVSRPIILPASASTSVISQASQPKPPSLVEPSKPSFIDMVHRTIKKYGGYKKFKRFLKKTFSLYLRDTGGQVEFQEMLPLLIFGPSIFFFVFRLDLNFKSKFTVEYRKSAGESLNCYTSSITTEEAFLQFLASVYAMDTSGDVSVKTHQPLVFVVGAHKDKLGPSADEKITELNKYLNSLIESSGFRNLFQYADRRKGHVMFTVDNTSDNDEDFELIRCKVSNLIRGCEEFTVEYPIRYLLFCLELQNLKCSVLSLDECRAMAAKYAIEEDQLLHLLQFLHLRIGVIRYFDKDGIKHIVIKEPQVLFNVITTLIIRTFSSESLIDRKADDFEKKGILCKSAFNSVCNGICEDCNLTSDEFLQLLVHLRITAPFITPNDPDNHNHDHIENRYFIPSVLNHVNLEFDNSQPESNVLPLFIKFKCEHVPKGLFGVLVTHFMTLDPTTSSTTFVLMQDKIFKNQVSFDVHSPGVQDEMALRVNPDCLSIKFFPEQSDHEDRDTSLSEVCCGVGQILETSILQSLRDLHYNTSKVEPFVCLRCDQCSELHRVKKGKRHKKVHCKMFRRTFRVPSQARCWYNEEEEILPVDAPPASKRVCQDSSVSQAVASSRLCDDDLPCILEKLNNYTYKWWAIAHALGFSSDELRTIEATPRLFNDAPLSYLREVLSSWLQWAPGDARGSTDYATRDTLRRAVDKAGLGLTAREL